MKKRFFVIFLSIFFGGIFFSAAKTVLACVPACTEQHLACDNPLCSNCEYCQPHDPGNNIKNPILSDDLNQMSGNTFLQKGISLVISLLFIGGTIVFFIMLLSGGVRWIASGGDKTHLEGAKGQITHALIGLVILLSAFAIIKLIGALFGIDLLNISLPTL